MSEYKKQWVIFVAIFVGWLAFLAVFDDDDGTPACAPDDYACQDYYRDRAQRL